MFYTCYLVGTHDPKGQDAKWVGWQLDPEMKVNSTALARIVGHHNVYHTNLKWFGAAAAVEVLCIALVLPTFVGWWRLGRPVSFSPIEIAKVSWKNHST